jgi:hypothetical protein
MSFGNAGVSGWKTYKSRNCFLKQEQVLWQVETQKEPRDSVVSFPFNFLLPKDVISSFYVEDKECKGIISYAIEVVAERLSVFKRNERVGQVFSVVAPADELQIEEAQRLGRGWDGTMTTLSASHQIKKMFWSQFPLAEAHVGVCSFKVFALSDIFLTTGGASDAVVFPHRCADTGRRHHQNQDEANVPIRCIERVAFARCEEASISSTT